MNAEAPGTVRWLAPTDPHPARDAHRKALACAVAGDKQGWLALWAEGCELYDPVGPSIFDPDGTGHHGRSGAEHFWNVAIAPVARFDVEVRTSYASGTQPPRRPPSPRPFRTDRAPRSTWPWSTRSTRVD